MNETTYARHRTLDAKAMQRVRTKRRFKKVALWSIVIAAVVGVFVLIGSGGG